MTSGKYISYILINRLRSWYQDFLTIFHGGIYHSPHPSIRAQETWDHPSYTVTTPHSICDYFGLASTWNEPWPCSHLERWISSLPSGGSYFIDHSPRCSSVPHPHTLEPTRSGNSLPTPPPTPTACVTTRVLAPPSHREVNIWLPILRVLYTLCSSPWRQIPNHIHTHQSPKDLAAPSPYSQHTPWHLPPPGPWTWFQVIWVAS